MRKTTGPWTEHISSALSNAPTAENEAVEDYFERTVVADAWDDGYDAGHATARAVNAEYPNPTPNPYRRAES